MSGTGNAFAIVTTSVGSREDGKAIARALVEKRLAACVKILPIHSVYRWSGDVEEAEEHLLICKIREADYSKVEAEISARHAYAIPEIIAIPITRAAKMYGTWLAAATER